ncbi:MAG TPA: flagellar FlbD family protein [Exilispira sp.]|nr:flagellar FlbD family protein [Exilispira sp.]HQJ40506.1 flagellar FlbD family protein [Exilispira sp.]HQQ18800.1 flagellar FlbD family protein [Exilispira sp.]
MLKEERMIKLTRINGKEFYLNPHIIEYIESVPDTLISLLDGTTIYVKERPEQVIDRIIEYRKKIGIFKSEL